MRQKADPQKYIEWGTEATPKIVKEYRKKYNRLSKILDELPAVLTLVHRDLKHLLGSSNKGRKANYTSENILRALLVHRMEGTPLRKTIIRIAESNFLQSFLRLGQRPVMDFTFLDRCFTAIRPQTWARINAALRKYAIDKEQIDPAAIRTDTTVMETNIHWPTDSSLLWDSWRVLTRLLRRVRKLSAQSCPHRFHDKKVRKLHLHITRYMTSKSKARQRAVKRTFKKLIEQVRRTSAIAESFCCSGEANASLELQLLAEQIGQFLPTIAKVCEVAERVQLHGEKVPAQQKVFSIFETHTELIKRGKRAKPVEFGHVIWLTQTKGKFICDYGVMKKRKPDNALTEPAVERHEKAFGAPPDVLAADGNFRLKREGMEALRQKVAVVAIPTRLADWGDDLLVHWQHFRAGIEGTISVLKRAFGLLRCLYRGFNSFASYVGLAVFCHNLVNLTARAVP